MSHLSEQILQTIEALPEEDQQQVLSFAEFLWAKQQQVMTTPSVPAQRSFFEVARASIGAGEGPGDLSTNPDHIRNYGGRDNQRLEVEWVGESMKEQGAVRNLFQ